MKPEDVYVSPNDEVFVTNFTTYYIGDDKEINEVQYRLEVGKWYKLGQKAIAPNTGDFIHVIHGDGKSIPHSPEHFMTKLEWREKQINSVL